MTLGARLKAYLFTGILVTAPISITFYLAWLVIDGIDRLVDGVLPATYHPDHYLPFSVPGLGLLILLVFLVLVGMTSAGFAGRLLVRLGEALVARMPVVRGIYSATKQIFETVLAQQSDAFREVVLVEFPRKETWSIAFITGTTKGEVQRLTDEEVVNVFVPTTPNPTSGYLMFVPRSQLVPLSMSVEEGLKMVVSGGLVTPPDREMGN
ncbi:DUF502 domain-containing protein [Niveispirillum sp. SYP-B3756]|nr:DUF502 domain-containing protein [Niveispirillum sp. SYP-B3756]MQP66476.1 DUF502 domain-containing protein [Niveispirillum sp. SYP-B3756]